MARTLNVTRYGVVNVNYARLGAYRLRVEVAPTPDNPDVDPNVFLYLQGLPDPGSDDTKDEYLAVCSPADMAEFPAGAPREDTAYPIFRDRVCEIDLRSVLIANKAWEVIVADIGTLLEALDVLENNLTQIETLTLGTPAAGGSASSASLSSGT